MDNIKISLKLHFYQPWWQFESVLKNIVNQCYRPILDFVRNTENFCFTANINAVLLELLERHGFHDVISGFREAVNGGKIELVGSTAQHPIFPLIQKNVQRAQIEEDSRIKERFGITRNSIGFYLPEMAFSRRDISLIRSYGYRWSIMDDVPFAAINNYAPFDHIVMFNGFKMFMRSGYWSNEVSSGKYSFHDIKLRMEHELGDWTRNLPAYVILAMDAETFGHHHGHLIDNLLRPMLCEWTGSKIVPIESLERSFPPRNMSYLPDGSWSTSAEDIRKSDPYPLWDSHFNIHHKNLWELVNLALGYFDQCRQDCLMITSSCHWWWISGRPYWNPEFMKFCAKGHRDLKVRGALDIVKEFGLPDEIKRAEELYESLVRLN